MKKLNFKKLYLPVGLLALGCAFGLEHFTKIPDFFDGFLIGVGIVWVIAGVFTYRTKTDS